MKPNEQKYRNRHRLNQFLNGLQLIVSNYNVSGSIATTTKFVFKAKLTNSEFEELATNVLHTPKKITKTTMTFEIEKLKVKITN